MEITDKKLQKHWGLNPHVNGASDQDVGKSEQKDYFPLFPLKLGLLS